MGPEQMAQALAAGACDYVMPDLERIGGVTGWMRAAALAQGAGVEMSSHLFAEASAQLLPVSATAHWLEYVDWADPVLVEPLRIEKGLAMPSLRPGLEREGSEEVPGLRRTRILGSSPRRLAAQSALYRVAAVGVGHELALPANSAEEPVNGRREHFLWDP